MKLLAAITEDDNTDFQSGYAACSSWARRHDKHPEVNYVAPEPDQLEAELTRARSWYARMKTYRNA